MAEEQQDTWLRTADVAALAGISNQWLRKLRYLGGGPEFSRIGTRVFYRRSDVEIWLRERDQ